MKKLLILIFLYSCNNSYYYPIVTGVHDEKLYTIEISNGKDNYIISYLSEDTFQIGDTLKFIKQ